jgi:hypothetical protein
LSYGAIAQRQCGDARPSILLGVALDEGLVTVNFAKGLKLPGAEGREQVWPDEAIAAFCATAIAMGRCSMALAVRMGADFGQREGDILKMNRGQRREDVMRIRPQKTRRTNRVIEVPILPELAQMLDETPKEAAVYVISEETGGPYKPDNFRHLFAEIRAKAGIDLIAREHGVEGAFSTWTCGAQRLCISVALATLSQRLPPSPVTLSAERLQSWRSISPATAAWPQQQSPSWTPGGSKNCRYDYPNFRSNCKGRAGERL